MSREHSEGVDKGRAPAAPVDLVTDGLKWLEEHMAHASDKPQADRDKLREGFEKRTQKYEHGQSGEENDAKLSDELKEIRKMNPEAVVAGVSYRGFPMNYHEDEGGIDWYKPFMEAANQAKACVGLMDGPTEQWYYNLKPAMDVMIKLSAESPEDFERNYKREFYNLMMKHGEKMIYREAGIFQFLLAFRRAKNICPALAQSGQPGVKQLKLVLGSKKGEDMKDDQFASMAVRKGVAGAVPDVKPVVPVAPRPVPGTPPVAPVTPVAPRSGVAPVPVPAPVGPVVPVEPKRIEGASGEIPKAGTPEFTRFIDKYDIPDSDIFPQAVATFDAFLKNREMDFLKNPSLLKDGAGTYISPPNSPMISLFGDGGEVYNLMAQFEQSEDACSRFYSEHPVGQKYAELYLLTMKKMIEYTQNCVALENSAKTDRLKAYHTSVIRGVDRLKNDPAHKQEALEQLITSAGYLVTNTPDDEDFDGEPGSDKQKWIKVLAGYEAEVRK